MNEITELIYHYCDLTEEQCWDLEKIQQMPGSPMHPGRRDALRDLVTVYNTLTPWGEEVMERVRQIKFCGWKPDVKELGRPDTRRSAGAIRKHERIQWVTSPHVKLLWELYTRPGRSYKTLCVAYSYDIFHDLAYFGFASGEKKRGAPWQLTPKGVELVEKHCEPIPDGLMGAFLEERA